MEVQLKSVGKKFRKSWIFRDLNHTLKHGSHTAILGSNGSGKSTLIQIISGVVLPSSGTVSYNMSAKEIAGEDVYAHVTFASPYTQLYEQLTLSEMLEIHRGFKLIYNDLSNDELMAMMYLQDQKDQSIENFSSGMKQRLKLALAMCSVSDLLLLDEPISNLDEKGINWYKDSIEKFKSDRTIVVCSNEQKNEYAFCKDEINLSSSDH